MKTSLRLFVLLFFISLLPRLLLATFYDYGAPGGDEADYDSVAWSLAQGNGFSDAQGHPTAFLFPAYPFFVAGFYKCFGHIFKPVFFAQAILSSLLCILMFTFTRKHFTGKTATLTFLTAAIYPSFIFFTESLLGDLPLSLLFFTFMVFFYAALKENKTSKFIFCGFLFGMCALIRGECLVFLPVFFLYYRISNHGFTVSQKNFLFFALSLVLTALPWAIRNTLVFKTFIPLSTRGGATLYNSFFIPEMGFGYSGFKNVRDELHTIPSEAEKDRYLMRKAVHHIIHHPSQVVMLIPVKLAHLFYPFDGKWYAVPLFSKYNILFGIVFCFAVFGTFIIAKENAGKFLLLPVIAQILNTCVFYGKPRFRIFIEPYMIIFASYCVCRWCEKPPFMKTFLKKIVPVLVINLILFFTADNITFLLRQCIKKILGLFPVG